MKIDKRTVWRHGQIQEMLDEQRKAIIDFFEENAKDDWIPGVDCLDIDFDCTWRAEDFAGEQYRLERRASARVEGMYACWMTYIQPEHEETVLVVRSEEKEMK